MTPLIVITLIILGTAFAISFSLFAVLIVVLVIGDDSPHLAGELPPLIKSFLLFAIMTAISAASFYTLTKMHETRYWSQLAMWAGLISIGWYYWV